MPISVKCPACGQAYRVQENSAGCSIKCRKCGAMIAVPGAAAEQIQSAPNADPAEVFRADAAMPARPNKKPGGHKGVFAVVGAIFVLFACCLFPAGGILGYLRFFKGDDGKNPLQAIVSLATQESDPLDYMPDAAPVIVSLRLNDVMQSELFARLKNDVPDANPLLEGLNDTLAEVGGLSLDDIDRVVTVIDPKLPCTILVGKKPFDIEKVIAAAEKRQKTTFKERKVGKHTVYEQVDAINRKFPLCLCVPEANILLAGAPSQLDGVLSRTSSPRRTDSMNTAMKRADWKQPFVLVCDFNTLRTAYPDELADAHNVNATYKIQAAVANIQLRSAEVVANAIVFCEDEQHADRLRKATEGLVALGGLGLDESTPKEVKDALNALKVSNRGREMVAELAVKHSVVSLAVQQALKPQVVAGERPPPKRNEGPAPAGWTVLFRSADPSLWSKESNEEGNFALPISRAHSKIRYLRLKRMDTGAALIVRISYDNLLGDTRTEPAAGYWWHGIPAPRWGAHHLGIVQIPPKPAADYNAISVTNDDWVAYFGSGFGHKYGVNNRQCYSWLGKEIPKTAFEIAVTCDGLTEDEKRLLK